MDTIILPLDGTAEAESALLALTALTREPARLRLLYVGDDPEGEHLRYLESRAEGLRAQGHETEVEVIAGDPASVIVETAAALDASLVIMKRDDRKGIASWVLGSITDKVARELPTALLLFNPPAENERWSEGGVGHVMVPLDGSATSEAAIPIALSLAERLGARVSVMYSVPWLEPRYAGPPELLAVGSVSEETDARIEADMHSYLEGLVERHAASLQLGRIAMRGPAADAVSTAAESHEVDLIVMTTQGASGIVHRGLGSVAEGVTKRSGVPVMLVRPLE